MYTYFLKQSEYLYDTNNFTGALETSEQAGKYYNGAQSSFMKGLSYFGLKDYQKAAKEFSGLSGRQDITNDLHQKSLFNLGNTKYFLGEQSQSRDDMIKKYQESIDAYTVALDLGDDIEITYNRQYVQNKLDALQQENKKTTDQSDSQDSSQNQKNSTQTQSSSGSTSQGTNSGSIGNNFSTGSFGEQDMTSEEQQYLQQYEEFLKQLQSQNQDAFNKVNPSGNSGDIFDLFTNDPFFQNLPSTTTQDW